MMGAVPAPLDRRAIASKYVFIVTNTIAIICLAWVLINTHWHELGYSVRHLHWGWVSLAAVSGVLVFVLQGWRWGLVLTPVSPVPLWDSSRAVYVGLFANEVLPFRAGEIIRCFLLGRWTDIPVSVTLASALIERIFDGFWLIACLVLSIHYTPHVHPFIYRAGIFLAVLVFVCTVFLGVAMYWKEQTLNAVINTSWLAWAEVLIRDLHQIGHSRYLYFAWMVSCPFLLLQVLPIYAMLRAFRPLSGMPWSVAFVLMVFLRLSSAVPQAPGNIGLFQIVAARTLSLFAVGKGLSINFGNVLWAASTLPILIVGLFAVGLSGIDMGQLHRQARGHKTPEPADTEVDLNPT